MVYRYIFDRNRLFKWMECNCCIAGTALTSVKRAGVRRYGTLYERRKSL